MMGKGTSKRAKRGGKRRRALRGAAKNVNLTDLRQKLAGQVAHNAPEMVDAAIGEVMKGQHQPMKFLFEMIGLYPASQAEEKENGNVLAETLLRRLHLPEEPEALEAEESLMVSDTVK
jgi:hypothetical protein